MIYEFIRRLSGYVKIRICGCSPERFLNLCRHHHIYIWNLRSCGHNYEMCMSLRGFRKLRPIARKTHTKVFVVQRCGLPFFMQRYRQRKLLFAGILCCILLLWGYAGFIWDIHFLGNETYTDSMLLDYLETEAVVPGMKKSEADCAAIVQGLREQYDGIVWASASIEGSRLYIQIKENEDTFAEEAVQETDTPQDLVAAQAGTITNIITRKGVPQVHAGDTVEKGDILVSGRVEVKNDAGEVIGYQYQHADADIFADTILEYEDQLAVTFQEKQYEKQEKTSFYIRICSWEFYVGSRNTPEGEWEQLCWIKQWKLGENFWIPVFCGKETLRSYTWITKKYTEEKQKQLLNENFSLFCNELEEKGIQICEKNVKIDSYEDFAAAKGTLLLNQDIGLSAETEMIEPERNIQDESDRTDD